MDLKQIYNSKVKNADDAVKAIKSGNRVVIAHAVGEPVYVVDKMVEHHKDYKDVEIVQLVPMGHSLYAKEEMKEHFRLNAFFLGGNTRDAVFEGRGDFTPCFFYQIPQLFRSCLPIDVALITVSPPDENGFCSFGTSCDYTKPAAEAAKIVIAQVNKKMPRTLGDGFIHINDIDIIVEHDEQVPELPNPKITDVEMKIGENCAKLINDGDTLQLGIGAIPDAVLKFLTHKKDLGIHSEMISDGVMDLYEKGVITCKKKNLHKGKMVVAFLMGTQKLYEFVHDNPAISMMDIEYVNNPIVIGQNDNMVSVNSALQVDLMGQVCAEAMGLKQFSGIGGQVDFIRGAAFSKGGKSILAFPSTAKKGTISKIVPFLTEGSAVTTSRTDVDYIVTEHGIAHLKGQTLKERARRLINIADPNFRDGLIAEFENRFKENF
ncbi:acetyl-CoA hydrolase/transferase family protein [Anaerofustis stercorihominis]|uniref:4-hydroxybutyrate coenzyme A transferase n=1 Tax=Anaerofustis stercorihominis DSM 17244 TaxID=445971 RepID=B1CB66_9FIRM|nr:acetyl-CoA hydrolase/transferase C-terminal domain-containing protein [Anaerofustis stercorihominis]EDS71513.1 4-hydroxybutyrate coenzyme A transferase [Anaerofustis stercorihominis DSM 17244]MCQ4796425.1 acetyl-CoA hydrolase/transferase family protein [Anaerofustis stercorihominis]